MKKTQIIVMLVIGFPILLYCACLFDARENRIEANTLAVCIKIAGPDKCYRGNSDPYPGFKTS